MSDRPETREESTPGEIVPDDRSNEPTDLKAIVESRVILSPSETRGKWKSFTEYVGSDPDSNVPGIRVDGWTDQDGVRWVRARQNEVPEIQIVFENAEYLPRMFLVRYDGSASVRSSARKVRRARAELNKRGL